MNPYDEELRVSFPPKSPALDCKQAQTIFSTHLIMLTVSYHTTLPVYQYILVLLNNVNDC